MCQSNTRRNADSELRKVQVLPRYSFIGFGSADGNYAHVLLGQTSTSGAHQNAHQASLRAQFRNAKLVSPRTSRTTDLYNAQNTAASYDIGRATRRVASGH